MVLIIMQKIKGILLSRLRNSEELSWVDFDKYLWGKLGRLKSIPTLIRK